MDMHPVSYCVWRKCARNSGDLHDLVDFLQTTELHIVKVPLKGFIDSDAFKMISQVLASTLHDLSPEVILQLHL